MAHVILYFTEQELRDLLKAAKETDGDVRIGWRRFSALASGYLNERVIGEQLKESGVDTKSGGTPHAVSRLIGVHLAMQRMSEGAGVVPAPLLAAASEELLAAQVLLEQWRTWAIDRLGRTDASSPRTDRAMMEDLEERLRSG